jgi:hypothetical protein
LTDSQKSFIWTFAAIVAVAAMIALFLALIISGGNGDKNDAIVAGEVSTPTSSSRATATEEPAVAGATETPEATLAIVPTPTATPPATTSSVSVTPNPLTPTATSPAPSTSTSSLSPVAQALARGIEFQYGVRIVDAGQDWGATSDLQVRNIAAVGDALAGLPASVRAAIVADAPLSFLSNHTGATEGGWEPYGQREANFYSNEDVSTNGRVAANQVVLQPGSNSQTIAHEIMHAYQMRDVDPGQYAMALLSPEMKSFMAATGWTQLGSDDDVHNAANSGWDAVNILFEYNGRALNYQNQFGDEMTLFTPNPVEAFAEAGGLYYGHNSALVLPEWPEYWGWFQANLG